MTPMSPQFTPKKQKSWQQAIPFPMPSWLAVMTVALFGIMYLPILVLAGYSFNSSAYSATWEGFSLEWYIKLLGDTRIQSALWDSLFVSCVAVSVSAVLGTLMAVGLARYRFPGKGLYRSVSYLPIIVPEISMAVAILILLATVGVPLSIWTIIAAHIVFCLAYIGVLVSARLVGLDPHLEEAALDLGATPRQAFIKVLLPELMPAIFSGCLLAFVLSMDDLIVASFTAGGGANTLPMEIFSRVRTGVKPDINALSVVLILFSGTIALLSEWIRYRSQQRKLR